MLAKHRHWLSHLLWDDTSMANIDNNLWVHKNGLLAALKITVRKLQSEKLQNVFGYYRTPPFISYGLIAGNLTVLPDVHKHATSSFPLQEVQSIRGKKSK